MTMSLETIRGLLNLSADAEPAAYVAALNAADTETAEGLITLADGMQFESPEQLVGWLAGALAVGPGDLGGIAAKVVELMGGQAPEVPATPPPEPGADAGVPGGTQMHDTKPTTPNTARTTPGARSGATPPGAPTAPNLSVAPQVVELSAAVTQLTARTQQLEQELAMRDAKIKVEADARSRGLALPKPVFDTLVNLSLAGDRTAYDAILGNVRGVPVEEKGTAAVTEESIELSAMEIRFAQMHGVTPEQMKAQKLATAGVGREA